MASSNAIILHRGILKLAVTDPRYRSGIVMESLEVRRVLSAVAPVAIVEPVDQPNDPVVVVDQGDSSNDGGDVVTIQDGVDWPAGWAWTLDRDPTQADVDALLSGNLAGWVPVQTFGGINGGGGDDGSTDPGDDGSVIDDTGVIDDNGDGSVIDDQGDGTVIDDNGDPTDTSGEPVDVTVTADGGVIQFPVNHDGGPIYYAMGGTINANERGVVLTSTGAPNPSSNQANGPVQVVIPLEKFTGTAQQASGDFSILLGTFKKNVTDDGAGSDLPFLN